MSNCDTCMIGDIGRRVYDKNPMPDVLARYPDNLVPTPAGHHVNLDAYRCPAGNGWHLRIVRTVLGDSDGS